MIVANGLVRELDVLAGEADVSIASARGNFIAIWTFFRFGVAG